ncbi:MBOAT family protein [Stutzerimonas stutzeri]|uniref:MBOAT family O-acyltransferase n=1 Tax=Stutzerimonas sp. S1 TaxID=3030652 RepID=UPI0022246BA5|nr:MBOAT family O-acyltransferase [Stutzerimonas sp. S1]MCW3149102.1 MBOAT family protein [Stutzerimonas sp. S1]
MLFNSVTFIAGFLPVVLIGFFLLTGSGRQRLAVIWLTLASLVFYGWWNPAYVPLLVGSMVFNYLLGGYLRQQPSRLVLGLAVTANVLLLGYYKYTGFLFGTLDDALGLGWDIDDIILPLAISFFTFQQIAYLVDAHDGMVEEHDFVNYCLFISFFPQLIAGPITHHSEMLAQFRDRSSFRLRLDNFSLGSTIFLLGLFKKVVIADTLGQKATPVFAVAADGLVPSLYDAWTGALTYTLQIYFDFSGYSDMAIGLGLLFGIVLPINFNSPFKARNVIDYWSRWHMTLTRFLTAYIYNPLVLRVTRARMAAGKPQPRRGKMTAGTFFALVAYPTMLTMFISGVWHGAGWQFVMFGLLHGFYLVVAHGWRAWKVRQGWQLDSEVIWHRVGAVLLTFFCVVVAMVFFRAANLSAALAVLSGMFGLSPISTQLDRSDVVYIVGLLAFVWIMPNIQQWMSLFRTALNFKPPAHWIERWLPLAAWQPAPVYGAAVGVLGFFALAIAFSVAPTEFLYFQF